MSAVPRRLNTGREVFAAIAGAWRLGRIDRGLERARDAGLNLTGHFWMIDRDLARGVFLGRVRIFV